MCKLKLLATVLAISFLCACSSGEDVLTAGLDKDNGPDFSRPAGKPTFYPLNFYHSGDGYVSQSEFETFAFYPLTMVYLFAPVDAHTLTPFANPKLEDFEITINGKTLNEDKQYFYRPVMQKVTGLNTTFRTAILIDTSLWANGNAVNKDKLIEAIKDYIKAALEDAAPIHQGNPIQKHEFILYAYARGVNRLRPNFSTQLDDLEFDLNQIIWDGQGVLASPYEAIVTAVAAYVGDLDYTKLDPEDKDSASGTAPTLNDGFKLDSSNNPKSLQSLDLSSIVLIAAGGDIEVSNFGLDEAKAALNWQALAMHKEGILGNDDEATDEDLEDFESELPPQAPSDPDDEDAPSDDPLKAASCVGIGEDMICSGKPLYYIAVGGRVNDELSELASRTFEIKDDDYNFGPALLEQQKADISKRVHLNNIYMLRFPIYQRSGSVEVNFKNKYEHRTFEMVTEITFEEGVVLPGPTPEIELSAGKLEEYLAGDSVSMKQHSSLQASVFWDFRKDIIPSAYQWEVTGGGARTVVGSGPVFNLRPEDDGRKVTLKLDYQDKNNNTTHLEISKEVVK